MADSNPFSRLLTDFQDVFASGQSQYFGISIWGHRIRFPKKICIGEIMFPVFDKSEEGDSKIEDCLFSVTVDRNEIGKKFAELARRAGAACAQLPADFQSRIAPYCPVNIQTPASWWIAMLLEFHGGCVFVQIPDFSGPRASIFRPFLVSIEMISQCGLHTNTPVFREREGTAQGKSKQPSANLDLMLFGGITPMPSGVRGEDRGSGESNDDEANSSDGDGQIAQAKLAETSKKNREPVVGTDRVKLFGQGEFPCVDGKEKDTLTTAQYNVIDAMIQAEKSLTKDDLDRKSGHGDARKVLKRLAKRDPGWAAVISFPGTTGKGYRIL